MSDTGLTWLTIVLKTYNSSSSYHRSYPSRRCRLRDDDWADHIVTLFMKVLVFTAPSLCLGHGSDCQGVPLNGSDTFDKMLLRLLACPLGVTYAPQIWMNLTWYHIF